MAADKGKGGDGSERMAKDASGDEEDRRALSTKLKDEMNENDMLEKTGERR